MTSRLTIAVARARTFSLLRRQHPAIRVELSSPSELVTEDLTVSPRVGRPCAADDCVLPLSVREGQTATLSPRHASQPFSDSTSVTPPGARIVALARPTQGEAHTAAAAAQLSPPPVDARGAPKPQFLAPGLQQGSIGQLMLGELGHRATGKKILRAPPGAYG